MHVSSTFRAGMGGWSSQGARFGFDDGKSDGGSSERGGSERSADADCGLPAFFLRMHHHLFIEEVPKKAEYNAVKAARQQRGARSPTKAYSRDILWLREAKNLTPQEACSRPAICL